MLDITREEQGEKGEGVRQRSSRMARKEFFKRWVPSQLGRRGHWLLLATVPFSKHEYTRELPNQGIGMGAHQK
jgi:hypothetical protein